MKPAELALVWAAVACLAWATVEAFACLRRDTGPRRGRMLAAVLAALGAAAAGLVLRTIEAGQAPIATVFDVLVLLGAVLCLLLLVLSARLRGPAVGIFLLPMALVFLVVAAVTPTEARVLHGEVPYTLTAAHVVLTLAGIAALAFGSLCGLMYLVHERRLQRASTDRLSHHLPSLEWLEHRNRAAIAVGFPLLTAGLGLGLWMMHLRGGAVGLSATDPKVVSSLAVWVLFALLITLGLRPRFRGRPVAYLTVLAFLLMVLTVVGIGVFWPTAHMFGEPISQAESP